MIGRRDVGIRQVQLGVIDVGLILLDGGFVLRDQRDLRIQLLARNGIRLHQFRVARQIQFGVVQQSLVVRQRSFRQIQLNLVRPRVDLDDGLTFLDKIAFVEIHFHQLAVDPRFDRNGIKGLHIAQPRENHRHAGARHLIHYDRNGADARIPRVEAAAGTTTGTRASPPGDRVASPPDSVSGDGDNNQ